MCSGTSPPTAATSDGHGRRHDGQPERAIDTAKFAQLKFTEDEVHNLINNQLTPEMSARIQKDRNAIARKFNLERAKLDAQQIDGRRR